MSRDNDVPMLWMNAHLLLAAIDEVKSVFNPEVQLFCQGQQEGGVLSTISFDQAICITSTSSPPRDILIKFNGKL